MYAACLAIMARLFPNTPARFNYTDRSTRAQLYRGGVVREVLIAFDGRRPRAPPGPPTPGPAPPGPVSSRASLLQKQSPPGLASSSLTHASH